MEEKKKKTLDMRVRLAAEGIGIAGKFNLAQYREKKSKHMGVCKELVRISDKYGNYPITTLVYFAIDKCAHKTESFDEGYDHIDIEKAETIISWLKMFATYNKNGRLFTNANIAHVLTKFYDKVSTDTDVFKKAMEKTKPNPFIKVFKEGEEALGIKSKKKPTKKEKVTATEVKAEDIAPKDIVEEAMAEACS